MEIEYGPYVHLDVVDMTRYERRNVYSQDMADLLYVEEIFGFVATYAPGGRPILPSVRNLSPATQDRIGLDRKVDPTANALRANPRGRNPGEIAQIHGVTMEQDGAGGQPANQMRSGPETDAELRYHLMTPRGKFILWAYDRQTGKQFKWVESPRPGFEVDAANGPHPLACDVVNASGEPHSISVHYQIKTAQTPCPVGSDRFVLSHRWEMSHVHDENYYLTRVIEGEIVFHAGVKHVIGLHPDMLRNQFLHPIPLGFQRHAPRIVQSSDGLTIRYVITDTDPTITFSPGDSSATRIEIAERHGLTKSKASSVSDRVMGGGPGTLPPIG